MKVFINAFLILFFTGFSANILAHVDDETMPDAVAEVEYLIMLDFEPENYKVRNKLGMIFYRKDKLEKAREQFQLVLDQRPEDLHAKEGMALILTREKLYEKAIEIFNEIIAKQPDNVMVYYHLGMAYLEQGNKNEAGKALLKSLENSKIQDKTVPEMIIDQINQALIRSREHDAPSPVSAQK